MAAAEEFITENLAIWSSAIRTRSAAGRGKSNKLELYGLKKLRDLILELAVRGLLVPQDPNDEPASELIKKIAADKAKLVKDGKIKKQKALPAIDNGEKSFDLPAGWEWCRLADVAFSQAGFAFKSKNFNESNVGLPLIRIRDVGQPFSGTFFDGEYRDEFVVKAGDYLISMDGNFRVASWDGQDALLNQRVSRLVFFSNQLGQKFIAESLQLRLSELQGVKAYTTVDHLSGGQISSSVMALPPAKEQERIVAKVGDLMALCDTLEQQQETSINAHQTLVQTLLDALTTASMRDGFTAAWARIAAHFDILFTTEWSIDQLKQTILQLAVMGKLVPQDPNDEPASELLEKIASEKERLIREKKIKRQKPLPRISDEEKSFELPEGWEWTRFGDILEIISDYHANGSYKILKKKVELLDTEDYAIMLRTTNFSTANQIDYKYITKEAYNFLEKSRLFPNDIIMNKIGDPGAVFFVQDRGKPMSLAMNLFLIRTLLIYNRFAYLLLIAFSEYVRSFAGGTSTQTITKDAVNNLAFPLPPNYEQKRIVAKVDELMGLCDALKARINIGQITQLQLADVMADSGLE